MREILEAARVTTLAEFERFLDDVRELLTDDPELVKCGLASFNAIGEAVHVRGCKRFALVKETLSDGSAVFDILVRGDRAGWEEEGDIGAAIAATVGAKPVGGSDV